MKRRPVPELPKPLEGRDGGDGDGGVGRAECTFFLVFKEAPARHSRP